MMPCYQFRWGWRTRWHSARLAGHACEQGDRVGPGSGAAQRFAATHEAIYQRIQHVRPDLSGSRLARGHRGDELAHRVGHVWVELTRWLARAGRYASTR